MSLFIVPWGLSELSDTLLGFDHPLRNNSVSIMQLMQLVLYYFFLGSTVLESS